MSDSNSGEEDNAFYFESDHLALRGNQDYQNMLRTIAKLEIQKMRVIKQLDELELAEQKYLKDPELLLQKLSNGEEIIAPNYMTLEEIPEIKTNYDILPDNDVKIKAESSDTDNKPSTVRGRIVDESKPETFNRLWSNEEQRRLEELLIEFPAEAIESRRYVKIAKALGNRTPQQVCSRVQKYFQKLHDAGLPIPGRRPKNRRGGQTKTKHFFRPTTFFPALNVPVNMPEDDFMMGDLHAESLPAVIDKRTISSDTTSDSTSNVFASTSSEDRERMLKFFQLIKEEKEMIPEGYNPDPLAALCDTCHDNAISRLRWRCNTCYIYLNQCSDCIVGQILSQNFEHLTHDVITESDM